MKKLTLFALLSTSLINGVPLGIIPEESILDNGADLSIYSNVYDVNPTGVTTQLDLVNLVAAITGMEAEHFQRFVCLPSSRSWSGYGEFNSEGSGADLGWQGTVMDLLPNEYFAPDLNQLLDENVLNALNDGIMQIVYQYRD